MGHAADVRRRHVVVRARAQAAVHVQVNEHFRYSSRGVPGSPALAIELPDGEIITGKTTDLLGPSAAVILNAVKRLGNISKNIHLIPPEVIEPVQELKCRYLGNHNPRLHSDEVLVALSVSAAMNPTAARALALLPQLKGCEAHSTVILPAVDDNTFRRLGVNLTCDPSYQSHKLYHK